MFFNQIVLTYTLLFGNIYLLVGKVHYSQKLNIVGGKPSR